MPWRSELRDGRSRRFPCPYSSSFFLGWTSTASRIVSSSDAHPSRPQSQSRKPISFSPFFVFFFLFLFVSSKKMVVFLLFITNCYLLVVFFCFRLFLFIDRLDVYRLIATLPPLSPIHPTSLLSHDTPSRPFDEDLIWSTTSLEHSSLGTNEKRFYLNFFLFSVSMFLGVTALAGDPPREL